jgi:hypothetical protein
LPKKGVALWFQRRVADEGFQRPEAGRVIARLQDAQAVLQGLADQTMAWTVDIKAEHGAGGAVDGADMGTGIDQHDAIAQSVQQGLGETLEG